jgi:hypothetical protein
VAIRRSEEVELSRDAEEAESNLSDVFGFSQDRGPLGVGEAFSLLASVDMVDVTRRDGRRLGRKACERSPSEFYQGKTPNIHASESQSCAVVVAPTAAGLNKTKTCLFAPCNRPAYPKRHK